MLKNLSIRDRRVVIVLVIIAFIIPVIIFALISSGSEIQEPTISPTPKPPLPTFADTPRVEGELTIKYAEGMSYESLSPERQEEIMSELESHGVVSQEKSFEATEGELSTFYLLKFKAGVDIESAAQEIYKLPEIESAEPNYEVGLF